MTWDAYHRRGAVLRSVVAEADRRRDGVLPTDVTGVGEVFENDTDLLATLQLRWHTALAGRIERALMDEPCDLDGAVLVGWRRTASALAGVREILDASRRTPPTEAFGRAQQQADRKEWAQLAAMAGVAGPAPDARAVRLGRELEERARADRDRTDLAA